MSDWQPGDLALCVKAGRLGSGMGHNLEVGKVYTVRCVSIIQYNGLLGLLLEGVPVRRHDPAYGYKRACRFIKVTPPEADEFDREVIELYTRKPEPAQHINRARHSAAKGRSFVPFGGRPTQHKEAR